MLVSSGMFAQAIYTSGTELGRWAVTDPTAHQDIRFVRMAEELGCARASNDAMMDCMRELDTKTIFETSTTVSCPVKP